MISGSISAMETPIGKDDQFDVSISIRYH